MNIETKLINGDKMTEWTIQREYGTGIFKAECKERNIVIHKNTYDEARVAMLETLVYTGTLSDADITAIITEVTEDVLAQCNTTLETDPLVRLSKVKSN